ncbi:hypothetical protein IV203_001373 [Nitzschia inconspicua]|uniref:Uncharacterized protein n=1 Tax=Nitzschia inconspicua TaxID=303405 RepID=A0A9K3L6X8_9STRA|nr:hypothetical protein IV203_001373 [Nitzschia inconspicua]
MSLTPQAQRSLKLFTAIATVGVGVQAIFLSDYNIEGYQGKEHIFTNLQQDTRRWIDHNIYGIDTSTIQQKSTTTRINDDSSSKNDASIHPDSRSTDKT